MTGLSVASPHSKDKAEAETIVDFDSLAAQELLNDAKRGASRAESYGSTAWKKPALLKTNKNFLTRTVTGTLFQNAWKDSQESRHRDINRLKLERSRLEARRQSDQCHFRSEGLAIDDSSAGKGRREQEKKNYHGQGEQLHKARKKSRRSRSKEETSSSKKDVSSSKRDDEERQHRSRRRSPDYPSIPSSSHKSGDTYQKDDRGKH